MPPGPIEPSARVLGPVVVLGSDGASCAPRGERSAALVVALALGAGRPVPVSSLVDALWTDGLPADPRAALQSLVSRLRATAGRGVVVAKPGGYTLDGGSDLDAATAGLSTAREAMARGKAADAAPTAEEALRLWRGTPGEGLGTAFETLGHALVAAAGRVEDELLQVRREAAVALGDHATVVGLAAPVFDADPTDEVAARDLLTGLVALGRADEAARALARLRHALVAELGTDPDPDLVALVHRAAESAGAPAPPAAGATASTTAAPAVPTTTPAALPGIVRASGQPLLGRDDDGAALLTALEEHPLVTILGPGGLGKTRLALEVAGRCHAAAPGTQVAVAELAGVRTDDDVVLALADALGITAGTSARLQDRLLAGDVREQLVEQVRSTPTLLVLDNCEHVVAGAAEWAAELLAAAPGLRILATSRAPLQLAAEQVYAPAPLDAAGAGAELFRRRATAARPGVGLPEDVVVRLVERLDGLPLAIELAAARVRTLSVEEIEAHLDERFALLRGSDRSAPERHRTLEAVIAWSWNLLEPSQQELWRRVAVLPDGFSAQAAAVLGRLDPAARAFDVLDDLDGLVTQSIAAATDVPGGTRYRMLETVRELGLARLDDAGEQAPVRDALWAWAIGLADRCGAELLGPGQTYALDELVREHENLLFALRAAAAPADPADAPRAASVVRRPDVVVRLFVVLAGQWALHGVEERAVRLAAAVTEAVTWWDVPREDRQPAALAMVFAAMSRGMEGGYGALRLLARLHRLLRVDDGDARGPAVGRRTRLLADLFLSTVGQRGDGMKELIGALRGDPDPLLSFLAHVGLAQDAENEGRLADSVQLATEAYAAALPLGDVASRSFAAMVAASSLSEAGDTTAASEWSARAREGFARLGTGSASHMLDWVDLAAALEAGDLEAAARLCDELETADRDAQRGPGFEQRAVACAGRAEIAFARGDVEGGLAGYEEAVAALPAETGPSAPWAIMMHSASAVRLAQAGRREAALAAAAQAARRTIAFMEVWAARGVDRPVLGTACVGAAAALAVGAREADDVKRGLELLVLAELLGSRQDLLALRRAPLLAALTAEHGATATAAARSRAEGLAAAEVPERALELLGGLGSDGAR